MVMGILNVTPDSFYANSRMENEEAICRRVGDILLEGGDIIDVGAYSSRPGAADVSEDEEMRRLAKALDIIRRHHPEALVSIDTFRASVARRCVEEFNADIINDISGGQLDEEMFQTVAALRVPYILMHMLGTPQTMQQAPHYEHLLAEVAQYFAFRLQRLHEEGVADVILDPGFGFGKTLEHNYDLLRHLGDLVGLFPDNAFLVGVSRKSMIYQLLDISPEEALNGTTVLHTIALQAGARILRVHDVKAAVETIRIWQAVQTKM
ncbi:MAG: dihydropteroate synthase [Bacteroidaceae bacterium]|nr:dihydropteroate synthase [Bacteroidaceae bacterium]